MTNQKTTEYLLEQINNIKLDGVFFYEKNLKYTKTL